MANSEGRPDEDEPSDVIIMQGWLEKQSDHLKKWRKRWTIIIQRVDNQYFIETYKKMKLLHGRNNNNNNATSMINISQNLRIKQHKYNDNTSGFIINIDSAKLSYEFKVYSIYNHIIREWINCIERIKYKQFPLKTSDAINRITNNQKLKSQYLYQQNSSSIMIYDHYKFIFLYYSRIYLSNDNPNGKLMKLIISYCNFDENDENLKCFKWIRNLSMLQNVETQRYYTPTIVYHTFNENCGASIAGHYFTKNLYVENAQYFPFNKTNHDNGVYFSIFRVGAPNICDLIMINKDELSVKNNFNDQDMDLYYHQLPSFDSFNVSTPSVLYHNNHLFAVGGFSTDYMFEKNALNDIYCLDLTAHGNEWQCVSDKTKLKLSKFGACLSFLTGNMLMVIGGCNKENVATKTVELYHFEDNCYIIEDEAKIKNKSVLLSDTQCPHFNAGIVGNIGYDHNKLCIGSGQNVELYDMYKDSWILTKNTNKFHYNPQLWVHLEHRNIVYVASSQCIEWMDIRKPNKFWTIYKQNADDNVSCYNDIQIV